MTKSPKISKRNALGRPNDIVEMIDADDAEIVLLTSGSMTSTARVAVKQLRERGEKVGICKIRMFRPFPFDALREAAGNISGGRKIKKIAVLTETSAMAAAEYGAAK